MVSEAVVRRCSVKKVFLESSQNSQENTCAREPFSIVAGNFIEKGSLAQVFSCEFYKISKNTILTEHHWWLVRWCVVIYFTKN